jgi:O-antigen/teichoic acid export membrane protein
MARRLFVQLSRESFLYGLSAAASKLAGLILVPLYARALLKAEFGTLDLLTTSAGVLSSLLILGLDTGAALRYYQTEDPEERRLIASTFLYFEVLLTTVVCAALFALARPLAALLFHEPAATRYVQLAVATVPFSTFVVLFLDIARLARLPRRYLLVALGNMLLTTALVLVAVLVLGLGIEGVLGATLIGSAVFSVVGWAVSRAQYTPHFSVAVLRRLLVIGLPVVPAVIALWVINFSNRWFLLNLSSLDDVAVLGMAMRLAAPVVLVVTAFQIAWVPFSLSLARHEAAPHVYARTLLYFLGGALGALLLLTLFATPLIEVFATPAYLPAGRVLALAGLSSVASGAYYIVATGVNLAGKTAHIGWTTVVAAIVSIALNVLLIPTWGVLGAAVAGLIANLIPVALLYMVAQRLYRVPYDLPRVVALAGISAALLLAATLLQGPSFAVDLALRGALLAAFGAALLALGVVRPGHLRALGRRLRGAHV